MINKINIYINFIIIIIILIIKIIISLIKIFNFDWNLDFFGIMIKICAIRWKFWIIMGNLFIFCCWLNLFEIDLFIKRKTNQDLVIIILQPNCAGNGFSTHFIANRYIQQGRTIVIASLKLWGARQNNATWLLFRI